jgi:imidazolonepropionase-like amidohydrolase
VLSRNKENNEMADNTITNIRIIDGLGSAPIENGFIQIENGKISAFGALQDYSPQPGDKIVSYKNCTVLPGLFDVHTHIYPSGEEYRNKTPIPRFAEEQKQILAIKNLKKHLTAGFTTVRDTGSENNLVWALRQAANENWLPLPRLLASGKLLTVTNGHGTEYGVDMAWECDSLGDLIKAVRKQCAEGADFIKLIGSRAGNNHPEGLPSWSLSELKATIKEAHSLGLPVSIHVSGCVESTQLAVRAGADSIEHGWGITPQIMEEAAKMQVFFCPTLSVYCNLEDLAKEGLWRRSWEDYIKTWGSREDRFIEVKKAHELGVPIVCGTDAGNPDTLHGSGAIELGLLVQAGLSPMDAIVAATSNAAKLCRVQEQTGCIAIGKDADLLIVEGDPLGNINILQNYELIRVVYKAGKLVNIV